MSCMAGGTPPTARKPPFTHIEWQVFHPNMVMSTGPDGETIFSRTSLQEYDIALGQQALTAGRHEWVVTTDRHSPLKFIGVALWDCARRSVERRSAWAVRVQHFHRMCESSANMALGWTPIACPDDDASATVRVLLDMDARTLSFSCDDGPMQVAYTGLPASVHPYLCSGATGELHGCSACLGSQLRELRQHAFGPGARADREVVHAAACGV